MTNKPANYIDSMSADGLEFKNFPFLKKRYARGFFNKFINGYFLFLLEDSKRLQCNSTDIFDGLLNMVFNPELNELNSYSITFLRSFIYGPSMLKESNELQVLENMDKFILAFKHARLTRLGYDNETAQNDLLRLSGLLLINMRMHIRPLRQPRIIETANKEITFCDPYLIKKSIIKYKQECEGALERLDHVEPCGRKYSSIAKEYFGFLDFFTNDSRYFLSKDLKDVLNRWYYHYRQGKSDRQQKAAQESGNTTGSLLYLRDKPPGSGRKKE